MLAARNLPPAEAGSESLWANSVNPRLKPGATVLTPGFAGDPLIPPAKQASTLNWRYSITLELRRQASNLNGRDKHQT
jgi:hypothetical protein